MKDNATRFIEAYSIIESHLKDIVNSDTYLKFFQLVNEVSKTNEIIASNKKELIEYSQLRNAIIHQRGSYDEIIAQPVDSVVNNIEYIANALRRDKKIKYLIKDSYQFIMTINLLVLLRSRIFASGLLMVLRYNMLRILFVQCRKRILFLRVRIFLLVRSFHYLKMI